MITWTHDRLHHSACPSCCAALRQPRRVLNIALDSSSLSGNAPRVVASYSRLPSSKVATPRPKTQKAIVPTMPQPSFNGLMCSIGPLKALVDEGCCQQMVQNMLASGRSHSIEVVSSPNGTLEGALETPFRGLSGAAPRCLIGARVAMRKRAHCCQRPHHNLRSDPTGRLGFGDQNPSLLIWLRCQLRRIKRLGF